MKSLADGLPPDMTCVGREDEPYKVRRAAEGR
jgi:hypothetical protein